MKTNSLLILLLAIMITSCSQKKTETENPFFSEYNTPFNVPPFDKIQNAHYIPAFEQGIKEHDAELEKIINNAEEPSFSNTIEALEYSGKLLNKVSSVFFNLNESNTSDEMQEIARNIMPQLSQHSDAILLNDKLFQRVKSLYDKKEQLGLNPEQMKLLDETYKSFIRNGANLNEEQKEKMKKINEELSLLSLKFGENLLAETNDFKLTIDNKEDLAGLPESVISGAAEESGVEGKWVFTLQKPSWIPFLQYSEKRDLREKLYKAMYNRGNNNNQNDNKEIIKKTITLRTERAKLLGFENHAAYTLDDCMAKTPEKVYELLYKLWEPAIKNAKKEAADMQAMINKEGGKFKLESWDWWYYAEKIRKEKYDLDDSQLRPYFELNNVRNGAFTLANKLYGINFTEVNNLPLPHPEAKAFEVKDEDGSHIGLIYVDYFPRESKRGGAWMDALQSQYRTKEGKNIPPVIVNIGNFSKPTGDMPALLSWDDVTTLFHEFGHGLHGLLSDCTYESLGGTSVPRDFVELPSQIMENWCSQPEMLKLYAKHYKTGEVIPQELIDKIIASKKFNQGFETVEYLAASILDMDYHTLITGEAPDVTKFEEECMNRIGLISEIIPRYKSTYFNHIWGGGYSAGYYSYIWAEVLDADAFQAFIESGNIFNREIGNSFRKNIISRGGTEDAMTMYLKFRGKEPAIEPLLKKRGLID
ncbi:MAG: M3 family metallopeptidase [Prolixibacteraceae bacterium]|nr:M3 family metallopeptidase [Prolixibacteraceae bacterium]